MITTWLPSLPATDHTLHVRVVDSIRSDIDSGVLQPNQRLPTHRDLARSLGIGIGTVTRAYAEAERQGLLTSRVGRGTFVADRTLKAVESEVETGPIDLSMNIPVMAPAVSRFPAALQAASRRLDIAPILALSDHAGIEWHRRVFARWLCENHGFTNIDWQRLLVCSGAQHAMSLTVRQLCKPGDTILVEEATFFGMRALAEAEGIHLHGIALDGEGMKPTALEQAVQTTGSRVLYAQPTLQNPTTRTMSATRRRHIADVCRVHNLTVIESDVYGSLATEASRSNGAKPPAAPLANLIPDLVYVISSASKITAPGLRIGFVIAPDSRAFDQLTIAMRAECFSPTALSSLIAAQWMSDGTANAILSEIAVESTRRVKLAKSILSDAMVDPSFASSLHVWLPMGELQAERVLNTALRHNVVLTPPSAITVGQSTTTGLRICLNGPQSIDRVTNALQIIATALTERPNQSIV